MGKYLLRSTVIVTGAIIMLLELMGTRVISPYYGNTLFTWTSLISTALVSLALGYYLGGIMVDRKSKIETMYKLIFIAGIIIILIPKISFLILSWTNILGIRFGSLASSLILFSAPLTLLAMVVPYALKLDLRKMEEVGITSGQLYALSTLGSLIGTILTGFYLIPSFSVSAILSAAGLVLSLGSGTILLMYGKGKKILFLLLIFLIPGVYPLQPLHQSSSYYGAIKIVDKGDLRYLLVDGSSQGCIYKSVDQSCFGYVHTLSQMYDGKDSSLLIGLGAGSLAKEMHFEDIVEIDPKIADIAKEYFGFNGQVTIDDGRHYIRTTDKTYDTIVIDAFSGYGIAGHLITLEAFNEAKSRLNPGGTLVLNTLGLEDAKLQESVLATLQEAFTNVAIIKIGSGIPNYVFFASDSQVPESTVQIQKGSVMTDDHNPSEFLSLSIGEKWREENQRWFGDNVI